MGASDQAPPGADAWIAAIHATEDDFEPRGSGVVLDELRILTCYHVVKNLTEKWVAFPKARGGANLARRQVERVVYPDAYGDVRDLAILVLAERVPAGVSFAPLRFPAPAELVGKRWWAFGFPSDSLGSSAGGRVGDALGYGWVRLHRASPDPVERGFSGGGLWCPDYQAVVGIVGQADGQPGGGRAITAYAADKWFPGQDLSSLARRQIATGADDVDPSAPEIAELARSLANLPDALAIVHEVFDRALKAAPQGATVPQLLALLNELVPLRGEAPLLQQVGELAAQRAVGAAQPAPASTELVAPSADDPCLLVVIHQNYFDRNNYLLSLTLFQDGEPQECDNASGSLKELKELLRRLVPAILNSRRGTPLIEFAVPEELLDTDFDQWPTPSRPDGPSYEDYRLGEKYPVVVRDLDRLVPGMPVSDRDRWESRWKLLLACEGPPTDLLREVDLQKMAGLQKKEAAFRSLRAALRLPGADGNAVLALLPEHAPAPGMTTRRGHARTGRAIHETLRAGFAEGMPAAIWLRHPDGRKGGATGQGADDGEDDRTYLENALNQAEPGQSARLRDLPRRVWLLRLQAEATLSHPAHPGRRLSLLWADPSRSWTPPDYQLPARSSNGDDL